MKEFALIDGDIVAYRCAAASANDPLEVAMWRCDDMMHRIIHETNAMQFKVYLSGSNNFRYDVYPDYKAHRKNLPKPAHLESLREHLVVGWSAKVTDGIEADDALGIESQTIGLDAVVCSIDKDLLQLPGYHYNFVRGTHTFISPFDGLRNFYGQVITGDGADNVPAFDGKFRNKTPKFVEKLLEPLQDMTEEIDMWSYVCSVYDYNPEWPTHEVIEGAVRNAKVLYIMKKENDFWSPPNADVLL